MSYSRRQLEALGEPFGSCATRVKPGGHGRIYGLGNEPAPPAPETGPPSPVGIPDPFGYAGPASPPPVGIPDPFGYAGPPAISVGIPDPFGYGPASVAPVTTGTTTGTTTGATTETTTGATTAAPTVTGSFLDANNNLVYTYSDGRIETVGGYRPPDNVGPPAPSGPRTNPPAINAPNITIGPPVTVPPPVTVSPPPPSPGGGTTDADAIFRGDANAIRNYINGLYRNELNRQADPAGLDWWTNQMAADGKITQAELDAWRAAATANKEPLLNQEQIAARRAAEEAARRAAEDAARQGGTRPPDGTQRPGGFLGTPFLFGQTSNPFYAGTDTRSDLVNMAYQRLLNRPVDQTGLAHYSQEMTRGLTGQGLVSALANSPEFQRTQDFQRAYTSTFRPGYQEFGPSGQYNQPIYMGSYTNYARSPDFVQPVYNTTMMTPQQLGYGFGSFNPFAYGGTNPFADQTAPPATPSGTTGTSASSGGSTAAAKGGRIKNDDGIAALLKR